MELENPCHECDDRHFCYNPPCNKVKIWEPLEASMYFPHEDYVPKGDWDNLKNLFLKKHKKSPDEQGLKS